MRYIAIEGVDTSGKSTQIDILKRRYPQAYFTQEPGGTKLGRSIRDILLHEHINSSYAEFFLFLSDRAEHIQDLKQLKNDTIITDRSLISGIAYAVNIDIEKAVQLNKLSCDGLLPTKVIFLKLSKNELQKRLSEKSHDKIEQRGVEYLLQIQENISKAIKILGIDHIILDASLDKEIIARKVQEYVNLGRISKD